MKTKSYLSIFFLCLVFVGSCAFAEKKIDLAYHLEKGQTFNQTIKMDMDMSQTFPGQPAQNIQSTMLFGYKMTVLNVDNGGNAEVEAIYDRVAMKSKMPQGEISYDSNNPPKNDLPSFIKPLIALKGQSFKLTFSPKGTVSNIKGLDKMVKTILANVDGIEPQVREVMLAQLKKQFSEKSIKESFEQFSAIFPKEAISLGDSWDISRTISSPYPMKHEMKLTLKKEEKDTLVIDCTSNNSIQGDGTYEMGSMKFKQDFIGSGKGSFTIDKKTGWTTSSKIFQEISGNIVSLPSEVAKEQINIPFSLKMDLTLSTD